MMNQLDPNYTFRNYAAFLGANMFIAILVMLITTGIVVGLFGIVNQIGLYIPSAHGEIFLKIMFTIEYFLLARISWDQYREDFTNANEE